MKKWEYHTERFDFHDVSARAPMQELLNILGADGWELMHVVVESGKAAYIFKRPVGDKVLRKLFE